jgi:hypothetical protein
MYASRRIVGPLVVLTLGVLAGFGIASVVSGFVRVAAIDVPATTHSPPTAVPSGVAESGGRNPRGICVHDATGEVPRADERTTQVTWVIDELSARPGPSAAFLASLGVHGAGCPIDPPLLAAGVRRETYGVVGAEPMRIQREVLYRLYIYIASETVIHNLLPGTHISSRRLPQEMICPSDHVCAVHSSAYYLSPAEFRTRDIVERVLAHEFHLDRPMPGQPGAGAAPLPFGTPMPGPSATAPASYCRADGTGWCP